MKVSLITTERNEADAIEQFLDSALNQSTAPDEIIIADGGSTDGTVEIIEQYAKKDPRIRLISSPGNRSVGRNAATEASNNEVIAVTDVGSRLDKDWLKNITKPFQDNPEAMVVAGFFKPAPRTFFEKVSSTLMLNPNDKINLATWLPSSRSIAYKKTAWKAVGGYPEHTNFNEDTPFDLALKAKGYKFEDGLKAIVWWRPRPNLKEFYKQYYWYAVGDGIDSIGINTVALLSLRCAILLIMIPILWILKWWLAFIPLAYLVLRPFKRTYKPWRKIGGVKAWSLMAILITVYDLSQIFGFWHGYIFKNSLRKSTKLVR